MNRTFSLNNVSDIGTAGASNTNNNATSGGVPSNETPNNKNVVVPLTQATINAFNTNSARFNYNNNNNSSRNVLNDNSTEESMSQLNYSCKLQSKYASSNYLNDYNQQQQKMQQQHQQQQQLKQSQQQYPQRTRTTPRRRTPRNAEEFLIAAGVVDTESYLNRGYYVGSMLNLNEFAQSGSISSSRSIQAQAVQQQQQQNHHESNGVAAAASSSSSSSASGFNNPNNKQINSTFKEQDLQMKRRNSIHDTTSISMANLNFLNNNFSPTSNASNNNASTTSSNAKTPTQSYFRNGYAKARSNTTAIIGLNENAQDENYSNLNNNTNSNGSSAVGSDSSSSPTPNGGQLKQQTSKLTLGPLMSAVSKLENVSLNSPKADQRFSSNGDNLLTFQSNLNEDEYDDYEYLERNLGAEPAHNITKNNVNIVTTTNTTTNTNVTDYYTDESNSCNNEDFNQFTNGCLNAKSNISKNDNLQHYMNEQSPLSINNHSSNNSCTTVTSPYQQQHHQLNNFSNGNMVSNNNYYYNNAAHPTMQQLHHHHHHHPHHQMNNTPSVNNAWDQQSLISNNVLSGWFNSIKLIRIRELFFFLLCI